MSYKPKPPRGFRQSGPMFGQWFFNWALFDLSNWCGLYWPFFLFCIDPNFAMNPSQRGLFTHQTSNLVHHSMRVNIGAKTMKSGGCLFKYSPKPDTTKISQPKKLLQLKSWPCLSLGFPEVPAMRVNEFGNICVVSQSCKHPGPHSTYIQWLCSVHN